MVSIDFVRAGCSTPLKTRGECFSELASGVANTSLDKAGVVDETKAQATNDSENSHYTTAGRFF